MKPESIFVSICFDVIQWRPVLVDEEVERRCVGVGVGGCVWGVRQHLTVGHVKVVWEMVATDIDIFNVRSKSLTKITVRETGVKGGYRW